MKMDMWQVTCDRWCVKPDTCQVGGGEPSLKMSFPKLQLLGIYDVLKIVRKMMTDWINESIDECVTKVIVEQPWLHRIW